MMIRSVTFQLPHVGNRPSDVMTYARKSLENLQLDYLDLYLIHMPFTFKPGETDIDPAKHADGTFVLEDTDHVFVWKVSTSNVLYNSRCTNLDEK